MKAATVATPLAEITDARSMYEALARRLHDVVLDVELRIKAEIAAQINRLKKERNAVILGHNYMEAALFHSIQRRSGLRRGCPVFRRRGASRGRRIPFYREFRRNSGPYS